MAASDIAATRLTGEEGFRSKAYRDTVGKLTIGYGFNVDAGITEPVARALLTAQLAEIDRALSAYGWYKALDDVRASVLLDVAFNVGVGGLLHFPKMIAAIAARNWVTAHDELLDSDAARMLPSRYKPLAETLLNGA